MTDIVSATDLTPPLRRGRGRRRRPRRRRPSGSRAARSPRSWAPSGSGKSTLMHCLAGLDTPTGGTVVIDGVELGTLDDAKLTELRRDKIGFIFQAFNLLPVLTAEENLVLPLTLAGRKPDREWLEQLIDDRRPRRPPHAPPARSSPAASSSASPSPARSSTSPPSSSPTSRPATSTPRPPPRCSSLLRRAVDEFGQTVVMVTHDPDAAAVADRLIELADGRIVRDEAVVAAGAHDPADVLRGLGARKLRTALTALAVVLGVAMISGTYVLTDTIDQAFAEIFQTGEPRASTSPSPARSRRASAATRPPPIDESLLAARAGGRRRAASPRPASSAGRRSATRRATSIGDRRRPELRLVGQRAAASTPFRYVEGAPPTTGGRGRRSTRRPPTDEGFEVGDTVTVVGRPGAKRYTLVGHREVRHGVVARRRRRRDHDAARGAADGRLRRARSTRSPSPPTTA